MGIGRPDIEILPLAFYVFVIAAPVAVGAFMLFFSRRFSLGSLQFRKAVWKTGFTDFDIRAGQVFAVVIGLALLVGGVVMGAQLLLR